MEYNKNQIDQILKFARYLYAAGGIFCGKNFLILELGILDQIKIAISITKIDNMRQFVHAVVFNKKIAISLREFENKIDLNFNDQGNIGFDENYNYDLKCSSFQTDVANEPDMPLVEASRAHIIENPGGRYLQTSRLLLKHGQISNSEITLNELPHFLR